MSSLRTVTDLFIKELASRGLPSPQTLEDGHLALDLHGLTVNISLDNIAREFARDNDPKHIVHFVDQMLISLLRPVPSTWAEAEAGIRFAAEPTRCEFGDSIRVTITDTLVRVLVHVDKEEKHFTWLTPALLKSWQVSQDRAEEAARRNLARLLDATPLEVTLIDGSPLGMLATHSASKASLLFSPNLKQAVADKLGWPILMMIPSRGFAYLIAEKDSALLGRVAPAVIDEYRRGAYPISTEVFRVDDHGIRAIGRFEARIGPEPAKGMKRIDYRGGIVRFCIPEHWEEAYEEEGGGTFYDEDEDTGTLRLNVLTLKTSRRVDSDTAVNLLETQAEARKVDGQIERLAHGSAVLRYRLEPEEGGSETTWFWEIVGIVPPEHARYAIFSFGADQQRAGDADIAEQVQMVDRELMRCEFADEVGD
jgi:hypothetical protein